jgi:4-methylaminobutanoate oxidase (formaldehyde-forming)
MVDKTDRKDVTSSTSSSSGVPDRARVVIIGGGVIGTSVAYHLAKLGWNDVVLLERDQLTSGTTWHAAGLIVSGGMTTEALAWMAKYSRDLFEVLEEETGLSTGFRPVGYLQTASTKERTHKLRGTDPQAAARGRFHGIDGNRSRRDLSCRGGGHVAAGRCQRRYRRFLYGQ